MNYQCKALFYRLLQLTHGDGLRPQLVRGGLGSFIVKVASTNLYLIVSIVLARFLGPEGYGVYSYVLALISLLAIPAQFGLPDLVIRETAKAYANDDWSLLRGLWHWSNLGVGIFAISLSVFFMIMASLFAYRFTELHLKTLLWGLTLMPLMAFTKLHEASLRGLSKVVQGQLPESIVRPTLLILFVVSSVTFAFGKSINASEAMALHVFASVMALAFSVWLLHKRRPDQLNENVRPVYQSKRWIGSCLPFAFIAGMAFINTQTDLIMLGLFTTPKNVGIYRVAAQGATLVSFGLTAVAMVTMPYFAKFHVRGEMKHFQRLATTGARLMLAMAIPVALAFTVYGEYILRFIFGVEYGLGYLPLVILSFAHVFHAGFGIVGPLLNMAGYEKTTAKGIAIAAVCNIILNFVFIPLYGMTGAALGTATTLIVWNVVLWNAVRCKLGVDSSALNLRFVKRPIH